MEWHLIAIGAGIGYLTNYLALKMLFLPRQPIKIGRFTIQGLFPKKWPTMIGKTLEGIQEVLPWYTKMPLIRQKIGHDIRQNLEEYDASKLEKNRLLGRTRRDQNHRGAGCPDRVTGRASGNPLLTIQKYLCPTEIVFLKRR
ncbi:MAG: hypothetical protein QMD78_03990 [Methanocellales archaeon]|nr:hypothetical protein [Methanocellales archaeon]